MNKLSPYQCFVKMLIFLLQLLCHINNNPALKIDDNMKKFNKKVDLMKKILVSFTHFRQLLIILKIQFQQNQYVRRKNGDF